MHAYLGLLWTQHMRETKSKQLWLEIWEKKNRKKDERPISGNDDDLPVSFHIHLEVVSQVPRRRCLFGSHQGVRCAWVYPVFAHPDRSKPSTHIQTHTHNVTPKRERDIEGTNQRTRRRRKVRSHFTYRGSYTEVWLACVYHPTHQGTHAPWWAILRL